MASPVIPTSSHQTRPFSIWQRLTSDILVITKRKNYVHGFSELDITEARNRIRDYRRRTGNDFSFTAFLAGCIAQAIAQNKPVQSLRYGNTLVTFDDVDINVQIEREYNGESTVAMHVIRAANRKSTMEIHEEIRTAQQVPINPDLPSSEFPTWMVTLARMPRFIRMIVLNRVLSNPFQLRQLFGTVGITSIGTALRSKGWGIPISESSIELTVGGISEQPVLINGEVCPRQMLCLTLSFDHDVVDGAPAARFATQFKILIEAAFGLDVLNA